MQAGSFCETKPFIRYAQRLCVNKTTAFRGLTAYDHRFFYCCEGHGIIHINNESYEMHKGTLILWPSGIKYDLVSDEEMVLFGFNFDYTWEHSFLSAPIPPASRDFCESDILERVSLGDTPCLSGVVYLKGMHLAKSVASEIYDEFSRRPRLYRENMSALFTSLLCSIVREQTYSGESGSRQKAFVGEILSFISEHHREEITNQSLGEQFGYHPNYINHLVVQHTGMSLHKYLLTIRINRAIDLLQTTDLPVSVISEEIGFADYNHFLKYFKHITGYTTKAFRTGKGK